MTFGGSYFGQPYFGGAPSLVVIIISIQVIPPTVAELIDSGMNVVELMSTGANLATLPLDGKMTAEMVASGANQIEMSD